MAFNDVTEALSHQRCNKSKWNIRKENKKDGLNRSNKNVIYHWRSEGDAAEHPMARTNTLSSVNSSSRASLTTRISTATEETARDKCLRLILMSYTSNWRFFTLGPRSPLHPVVDPARLMSRLPSPSATDPVQCLTSNHQQQTLARSDGSAEWKEISNNGRRDKGMIRFIHVRERNLIIMCVMDSTFPSTPTSPPPHPYQPPRWKRYFMMVSFNQIFLFISLPLRSDRFVCNTSLENGVHLIEIQRMLLHSSKRAAGGERDEGKINDKRARKRPNQGEILFKFHEE